MNWAEIGTIVAAVLAGSGVGGFASAWITKRKHPQEVEQGSVKILKDVIAELRTELQRVHDDCADTIAHLKLTVAGLQAEVTEMDGRLRQARQESRGAHETTGRAMRRVEHLEDILRSNGIVLEGGPLV